MEKKSDESPPSRARKKEVPIKFVTMLAEADGEKFMNFDK